MLNWASTPAMDSAIWHQKFEGQAWQYDSKGVYLKTQPNTAMRTPGEPVTCRAILDLYGAEIFEAATSYKIPPELIVMTIATEVGSYRSSNFTGPSTFRWEAGISDYSAGPMQLLGSTARGIQQKEKLPKELNKIDIPRYDVAPSASPSVHPLYDARLSILLGTAYISSNITKHGTGFDPILVAACYNRGRLAQSVSNPWHLVVTGDHLDRAAKRFGDACAALAALRQGQPGGGVSAIDEDDSHLELYSLTKEQADEEQEFYLDSGADVTRFDQNDGLVTLLIDYPPTAAGPPTAPNFNAPPTGLNGFVLYIDRKSTEKRAGKDFPRTVGVYQAFYDGQEIPGLSGFAFERQGPDDNTAQGRVHRRRISAGTYPLYTHSGSFNKYKTYGYDGAGGISKRPWPALRVGDTGKRVGILIHPAKGYLMSVGCINLTGSHVDSASNIDFEDSRNRVIAIINAMKTKLSGSFPSTNNAEIQNCKLVVRGSP